jgi:hypothetical protein
VIVVQVVSESLKYYGCHIHQRARRLGLFNGGLLVGCFKLELDPLRGGLGAGVLWVACDF